MEPDYYRFAMARCKAWSFLMLTDVRLEQPEHDLLVPFARPVSLDH